MLHVLNQSLEVRVNQSLGGSASAGAPAGLSNSLESHAFRTFGEPQVATFVLVNSTVINVSSTSNP